MGIIGSLFRKKSKELEKTETSSRLSSSTSLKNSLITSTEDVFFQKKEKTKSFWSNLFARNEINNAFYEELEETLIRVDIGAKIARDTVTSFRTYIEQKKIIKNEEAIEIFKTILKNFLLNSNLKFAEKKIPVLCLVGVNGVGKTTTLAKLASDYQQRGYKVVIAAADTFRAAAIPQLEEWAKRVGAQVVSKGHLSDAAAVAYDAVEATLAKGGEKGICLIDTAGRLENKSHLMEQLGKLVRILNRFSEQIDLKKLLVVDATLGNNGMDQARIFSEKIGLDGIIITKIDTEAKAGFLLTISRELELPICFLTYGENLEDISPFNPDEYIETLFNHIN